METSLLSSHLAVPRVGHLEQVLRVLGCLKLRPERKLAFVPARSEIDCDRFQKCDWTEFHRDASEAIPGNMSKPKEAITP